MRECDAIDRQFLIVSPISRQPGHENSEQRDKADDEAQPNHVVTQMISK